MPLYEYICKQCGHPFEMLVNGSTVPKCPACQSKKLEKQHSVFAASVKDGGRPESAAPPSCGSCGDPRGPGACSLG
ncbi:MAG: zinc ribbon domain-containing protein [Nitrospinales bacterium]